MGKNNLVIDRANKSLSMHRVFNAPREIVWKVVTDPAQVPNWWGPRKTTTVVDKMDFRVGGVWRYLSKDLDGNNEVAFNGVYRETDEPNKLIYTFEFEPVPGHVSVDCLTFEELPGGKTKITDVTTFDSVEALEGMVGSGMEGGATETWDRLDELVQKVQE